MAEEQNRTLQDKFMLRLPDGMRARIKAAAERNGRSMNSEIVAALEEKYPAPAPEDLRARILSLMLELQELPEGPDREAAYKRLRSLAISAVSEVVAISRQVGATDPGPDPELDDLEARLRLLKDGDAAAADDLR